MIDMQPGKQCTQVPCLVSSQSEAADAAKLIDWIGRHLAQSTQVFCHPCSGDRSW